MNELNRVALEQAVNRFRSTFSRSNKQASSPIVSRKGKTLYSVDRSKAVAK